MQKKLGHWVDGWMDGWMDVEAGLRIAYSNRKKKLIQQENCIGKFQILQFRGRCSALEEECSHGAWATQVRILCILFTAVKKKD